MVGVASIAEVAALIGDPARANMLYAMVDDGPVSAGDLSAVAGVAPSTASEHLAKLCEAGMVRVNVQGRRRYYSLTEPGVAQVLSAIEGLAGNLAKQRPQPLPWDQGLVHARACLDHLAGRLGGALANAAMARGLIRHRTAGPELTRRGAAWVETFGVDAAALQAAPRRFLRLCPDWIDDSPHLGGGLGAALLKGMVAQGWLRRVPGSRKVRVTPKGIAGFRSQLDLDVRSLGA